MPSMPRQARFTVAIIVDNIYFKLGIISYTNFIESNTLIYLIGLLFAVILNYLIIKNNV